VIIQVIHAIEKAGVLCIDGEVVNSGYQKKCNCKKSIHKYYNRYTGVPDELCGVI
jgi:hypothetical protein